MPRMKIIDSRDEAEQRSAQIMQQALSGATNMLGNEFASRRDAKNANLARADAGRIASEQSAQDAGEAKDLISHKAGLDHETMLNKSLHDTYNAKREELNSLIRGSKRIKNPQALREAESQIQHLTNELVEFSGHLTGYSPDRTRASVEGDKAKADIGFAQSNKEIESVKKMASQMIKMADSPMGADKKPQLLAQVRNFLSQSFGSDSIASYHDTPSEAGFSEMMLEMTRTNRKTGPALSKATEQRLEQERVQSAREKALNGSASEGGKTEELIIRQGGGPAAVKSDRYKNRSLDQLRSDLTSDMATLMSEVDPNNPLMQPSPKISLPQQNATTDRINADANLLNAQNKGSGVTPPPSRKDLQGTVGALAQSITDEFGGVDVLKEKVASGDATPRQKEVLAQWEHHNNRAFNTHTGEPIKTNNSTGGGAEIVDQPFNEPSISGAIINDNQDVAPKIGGGGSGGWGFTTGGDVFSGIPDSLSPEALNRDISQFGVNLVSDVKDIGSILSSGGNPTVSPPSSIWGGNFNPNASRPDAKFSTAEEQIRKLLAKGDKAGATALRAKLRRGR